VAVSAPRRRFTVDEYYAMAKHGILKLDERVVFDPNTYLRDRDMVVVTKHRHRYLSDRSSAA
jgi:hypothetical protein